MIRLFAMTGWLCSTTIAGTFLAFQLAHGSASKEEAGFESARTEHYIETELLAVPVINESGISGYFLARMGYVFDAAKVSKMDIPIELLIKDMFLSFAYNNVYIDISNNTSADIIKFSDEFVEYINNKLESEVMISNLILQVDYRRIAEVRASITENH